MTIINQVYIKITTNNAKIFFSLNFVYFIFQSPIKSTYTSIRVSVNDAKDNSRSSSSSSSSSSSISSSSIL